MTKTAPDELAPSEHAQRLRGHAARFDSLGYIADAIMLRETAGYLDRLSAPQQVTEEMVERAFSAGNAYLKANPDVVNDDEFRKLVRAVLTAALSAKETTLAHPPKED